MRRRWLIWLTGSLRSCIPKGFPGVKNFAVLNLLEKPHTTDHSCGFSPFKSFSAEAEFPGAAALLNIHKIISLYENKPRPSLAEFAQMQKARGHQVTVEHVQTFSKHSWTKQKINPRTIITPYREFRKLVYYSRPGLTNQQALQELVNSDNIDALALLKEPLHNSPPIIVFECDGKFILEDGAKRSLSACFQGFKEIDVYIGLLK